MCSDPLQFHPAGWGGTTLRWLLVLSLAGNMLFTSMYLYRTVYSTDPV